MRSSTTIGWRARQSTYVNEERWRRVWEQAQDDLNETRRELDALRQQLARTREERNDLFDLCRMLRLENRRLENEVSMRAL